MQDEYEGSMLTEAERMRADTETIGAKEISPLEQVMAYHRNAITDLDGELRLLATQLTAVTQPFPESDGKSVLQHDPSPPRSPHVADVIAQNERVTELVERVRTLRSYLDVR